MEIILIAAVSKNRIIGSNGNIPWDIPEDISQYKERIKDETVVFGRKSFDPDHGRSSPSKHQLILSRDDRSTDNNSATYVSNVDETINLAKEMGVEKLLVLGGGEIYSRFLELADKMILSEIPNTYSGTTKFPEWDNSQWEVTDREKYDKFEIAHYERNSN
jgi:Dihydrofolate reductase